MQRDDDPPTHDAHAADARAADERAPAGATTLADALAIMRDLRARCSWDAAQTHASLRPYLLEEAHELDDAIRAEDDAAMREELGDVLLQVLFHGVVAEERGAFGPSGIAEALVTKMRARHPHLYGDGARVPWERQKARRRRSIVDGLPVDLPALHRAHRLQDRAAGVGFDWPDAEGPAAKVAEELDEVRAHLPAHVARAQRAAADAPTYDAVHERLEDELGDLLFSCVNLCRKVGVHASLALDRANRKFAERFTAVERLAGERGIVLGDATPEELDALWEEVKRA